MSSLRDDEKRYFEKLFNMESGYVLDYKNETFAQLFSRHGIDIHSPKYTKYGKSKAKKMRAFWEIESDEKVVAVLSEILKSYETKYKLEHRKMDTETLERCYAIIKRLEKDRGKEEIDPQLNNFLKRKYAIPDISLLPINSDVKAVIETRLLELPKAMDAKAYLSVIFLAGSILEGVLLGAAFKNPEKFNRAKASPKADNGKVKPFREWSLSNLIDISCEVGLLSIDIKKFSHGLRDFRNYIHPYEQIKSKFTPDANTARIVLQVLKAALAEIAGQR